MGAMLAALFLEPGGTHHQEGRYHKRTASEFSIRAELILNSFYNELHRRYIREREILERQAPAAMSHTKWNQQEVYLDFVKRERARDASHQYLERHREWLSGPHKYSDAALIDLVSVQHYIDLDLEDLLLPEAERRNSDVFRGTDGTICEPFLRDASRCNIDIDGQEFNFSARLLQLGISVDDNPAKLIGLRKAFLDDLVSALLRCLGRGGEPPPLLVRAVTSTMSQSGLASVERACHSSQVVVNGGDQRVTYRLRACADGTWEVTLSVEKVKFEECLICSHFFEDPSMIECKPTSSISKSCSIRFCIPDAPAPAVRADVYGLQREIRLENLYGFLITGHTLGYKAPSGDPQVVRRDGSRGGA